MTTLTLGPSTVLGLEKEVSSYSFSEDIKTINLESLDPFLDETTYPYFHNVKEVILNLVFETGFCYLQGLSPQFVPTTSVALGHYLGFLKKQKFQNAYLSSFQMSNKPSHASESLKPLPIHTDFSVEDVPPRITIIGCIEQDPGYPKQGCTILYDLYDALDSFRYKEVLESLEMVLFPFASPTATDPGQVIRSPIITRVSFGGTERFIVRFQRGVIARGFTLSDTQPSEQQNALISTFLDAIIKNEIPVPLASGDILVFDNHRILHARTRGSVVMDEVGVIRGRRFLTGFVQGLRPDY